MDEEEERDHGIGTLRARIRDWVVTPEPRETPNPHRTRTAPQRVHAIDVPRTRTPAAGVAFNQDRSTPLKVRLCSFHNVLCVVVYSKAT